MQKIYLGCLCTFIGLLTIFIYWFYFSPIPENEFIVNSKLPKILAEQTKVKLNHPIMKYCNSVRILGYIKRYNNDDIYAVRGWCPHNVKDLWPLGDGFIELYISRKNIKVGWK